MESKLHPVVELLIQRMESNPQEFEYSNSYGSRWVDILEKVKDVANSDELTALTAAYGKMTLDRLHEQVMKRLMGQDPTDPPVLYEKKLEQHKMEEQMRRQLAAQQMKHMQRAQGFAKGSAIGIAGSTSLQSSDYNWIQQLDEQTTSLAQKLQNLFPGPKRT
jgi:hypothetical protein